MKKKNREVTNIFVVEDNPLYRRMITYIMEFNPEHKVHVFKTGEDCIRNLHLNPSIISLDYHLPDIKGGEVLKRIKEYDPDISVIMVSNQNDVYTAISLLRDGASDYICKDENTKERLLSSIAFLKNQEKATTKRKKRNANASNKLVEIIGVSDAVNEVKRMIAKAVSAPITVSITGETGSGKEVVAKAIHYQSSKSEKPFVAVNVSAIPTELLESELFGHEKGAFTGASNTKKGFFELAEDGTLFLDEIGELNINMQAKLLRALQEREFFRVGGEKPLNFNARVIVATHRNLKEEIDKGNFREDLYYRLLGLPIKIASLRARREDILLLARHFLEEFTSKHHLPEIKFSKEAEQELQTYDYPGNIRELKAVVELSAVLCSNNEIRKEDLRFDGASKPKNLAEGEMTMDQFKKAIVDNYLQRYNKNIDLVAQKLQISRATIYRMLKEKEETKVA
ncbi:MAG: sigma-54 dependent transcriptional regulator [Bacteroidota bacterium]